MDSIVECLDAPFDRGIARELSKSVVVEEWRRSPDTDQRGHAIVAGPPALGFEFDAVVLVKGIVPFLLLDLGEILVGAGGEIVPNMARLGIRSKRTRRIRFDFGNRIPAICGKEVVVEKIGFDNFCPKPRPTFS